MARHPQRSVSQELALIALALVAGLRPVWGASIPIGSPVLAVEAPACCVEPEPGSCCPEDENSESVPAFLPACCGVDAPPNDPRESEPLPRSSVPDPTKRVLRELVRAGQQVDLFDSGCFGHSNKEHGGAGLSPPDSARGARALARHWLTDRELLAALALLSIARL